jgi:hypothetical protein
MSGISSYLGENPEPEQTMALNCHAFMYQPDHLLACCPQDTSYRTTLTLIL